MPIVTAPPATLVTMPPLIVSTLPTAVLAPTLMGWAFTFQRVLVRTVTVLLDALLPMMIAPVLSRFALVSVSELLAAPFRPTVMLPLETVTAAPRPPTLKKLLLAPAELPTVRLPPAKPAPLLSVNPLKESPTPLPMTTAPTLVRFALLTLRMLKLPALPMVSG